MTFDVVVSQLVPDREAAVTCCWAGGRYRDTKSAALQDERP